MHNSEFSRSSTRPATISHRTARRWLRFSLASALLVLYLGRGDRETDIRQFVIAGARARRYLPKPRSGDCDTDVTEVPTQSSRLPAGQRPILHQDAMRRACHERQF